MCLALIITYLNLSLLSLTPIQQLLYEGAWWFHDFETKNKIKSLFNDLGESCSILGLYILVVRALALGNANAKSKGYLEF